MCAICNDFYKAAKNENIEIFYDTYVVPRGTNQDGTPKVSVIQIKTITDSTYTLPIGEKLHNVQELSKKNWDDILKYADTKGIKDKDTAYNFIVNYTNELMTLYKRLKIYEVHSYPHLGRFIEFKISNEDYMIYCPDATKIYHKYWTNFFKSAPKYGDNWYYEKKN